MPCTTIIITTTQTLTSPSTAANHKSLEKRITALSIKIATDRANRREMLPLDHTTWKREDPWSADLERFQIELEELWIEVRGQTLEFKTVWVDAVEKMYADEIGIWRASGMV
ncbi:hypothetical protein COCMIDRAFT_95169 [Bipolaris oryzae ATCC 44560]|uniref:Uncharacterized protein n=1 Tax=Bipolaris oryzae ATCC 44560 TaxID=930090 RepID=W6Z736_COCMI|nr:uncharacterized protein COCMIDRAFT_95169 [Bipolaris oryzae ATCC 44560]EUC45608.1 hypothetical protein COCMIDRAFT_95169 [Bipolaris oryzae ATCC 44560]